MMDRKLLVVGNWKMYLSYNASMRVAEQIANKTSQAECDVVICPSFPMLSAVEECIRESDVELGTQDIHEEESGAYTGETSVLAVRQLVRYAIVGHSERRGIYGETYDRIAKKAAAALKAGIHPIVCVGETAQDREEGNAIDKIRRDVTCVAEHLQALDVPRIVFAYEPIWAIAPSQNEKAAQPSTHEVAEIAGLIRKVVSQVCSPQYLDKMRVLYGGSVTSKTVSDFVSEPGVDGALVGGASTKPGEFLTIIKEVQKCHS